MNQQEFHKSIRNFLVGWIKSVTPSVLEKYQKVMPQWIMVSSNELNIGRSVAESSVILPSRIHSYPMEIQIKLVKGILGTVPDADYIVYVNESWIIDTSKKDIAPEIEKDIEDIASGRKRVSESQFRKDSLVATIDSADFQVLIIAPILTDSNGKRTLGEFKVSEIDKGNSENKFSGRLANLFEKKATASNQTTK